MFRPTLTRLWKGAGFDRRGLVTSFDTGSAYYRRQKFDWGKSRRRMYKTSGVVGGNSDIRQNPLNRYRNMPGDVRTTPNEDYTYNPREDGVRYAWRKRGRLQLHFLDKREYFVCFHCSYPVRDNLVAIKEDNWDYRMCHGCYNKVVSQDLQYVI
eukprot:PhM_4_TR14693/c0_g2_i1/m.68293